MSGVVSSLVRWQRPRVLACTKIAVTVLYRCTLVGRKQRCVFLRFALAGSMRPA